MADSFDRYDNEGSGGGGFMMGLLTGTVLGAGLGMLLAPKAGAELRGAIGEQARNVGQRRRSSKKASEVASGSKKASETAGHVGRARPRHRRQGARSGRPRRRRGARLRERHDRQRLQLRATAAARSAPARPAATAAIRRISAVRRFAAS